MGVGWEGGEGAQEIDCPGSLVLRVGSVGLDEALERVHEAGHAADAADDEDGNVEEDLVPQQLAPEQTQVEEAGQQEAEASAGEAAREAHEQCEVRDVDGHEQREDDQRAAQRQPPGFETAVAAVACGEEGAAAFLEERLLQHLDGSEEGQRVGQQRLGHQEDVDHSADGARQVIRDDLLGLVGPGEVGDEREEAFEHAGGDVRPVHHAVELAGLLHVALQRRQEDLRRVAEHDDADGDGKLLDVDIELDLLPGPVARPR